MSLIQTAVGLVAMSDPIGILPLVHRAAGASPQRLRRISRLATVTYTLTLLIACWWGQTLLGLFGISLEAFRLAGGLILLPIGLRLIEGREAAELDPSGDARSLAVVPIGLPMLAGPGAISLVIADAPAGWAGRLGLSGVILSLAVAIHLVLLASLRLRPAFGALQEQVFGRLMGVLLTAIAVQMLLGGLRGAFPALS